MEAIGGYFELELRHGEHYHKNAIKLNTARNCFEYIVRARMYSKVYLPYYTCDVMLQPILKLGISYQFYSINDILEPREDIILLENEGFLYTNYFGLKQECVKRLAKIYGSQLIVDNAQAFYAEPLIGIDTFYSTRKFFGVPDGGYLYTDCFTSDDYPQDISYERIKHLLQRIEEGAEKAYSEFRKNDDALDNQPIKLMSKLTERLMENIDYQVIKEKRRKNFSLLHEALKGTNLLKLKLNNEVVPMVYPYWCKQIDLKHKLIDNKIFVPTYWPNTNKWCCDNSLEYSLAEEVVFLPIDQRVDFNNIKRIINQIKNEQQ